MEALLACRFHQRNLYYIESKDNGESWANEQKEAFSLPISATQIDPIIESPNDKEYWIHDVVYKSGSPWILFSERKFPWIWKGELLKNMAFLKMAKFDPNKKQWIISDIIEMASLLYPAGACFHPQDINRIFVAIPENGLSKIYLFTKDLIQTKYVASAPLHISNLHHINPQRVAGNGPFKIVWMECSEYNDLKNNNTQLKALQE